MKINWRRIFTIVTIAIVVTLGIAIWRVGNENIPQPKSLQEIKNGKVEGRRAQFASWSFDYQSAQTESDQITQEIDGIHDGVYYKNNKPLVRMRADRVIYNTLTHDFTVAGPAHFAVDDKGKIRTLDTSNAVWSELQQTLTVPGEAFVGSDGGARLRIKGLAVNLQTGQYTLGSISGGASP